VSDSQTITLIVVEAESPAEGDDTGLPKESFEQHGIKDLFRGRPKKVELSKLTDRMADVQDEVDKLLSNLKRPKAGYRLSEVQVSLAISGNGSIGVATVGAEASIALTFTPSDG
jgi:predicted Zn-dependent protease